MLLKLTAKIIDPHSLSAEEKELLTTELFATHKCIFDGINKEEFGKYVVDSPANYTRIQVLRFGAVIVGYIAFHAIECNVANYPVVAVRIQAGMLQQYRGQSYGQRFLMLEFLKAMIRYRVHEVWAVPLALNPVTYRALVHKFDRVWPHWGKPTPEYEQMLMDEFAAKLELQEVQNAPGVYHTGCKAKQTLQDNDTYLMSSHPAVAFFMQLNPHYYEVQGLLTLVPVSMTEAMRATGRLMLQPFRRHVGYKQRMLAVASLSVLSVIVLSQYS